MKASDPSPSLKKLRSEFAAFRARCRPHARIPDHLRQAVILAIDAGIETALIAKALGLSGGQVATWRRGMVSTGVAVTDDLPRILSVAPPSPAAGMPPGLRVSYEAGRLLLEISF